MQLGGEAGAGVANTGGVILPKEARDIDEKVDDGLRDSGRVRGLGCTSGSDYDAQATARSCYMQVQLDTQM